MQAPTQGKSRNAKRRAAKKAATAEDEAPAPIPAPAVTPEPVKAAVPTPAAEASGYTEVPKKKKNKKPAGSAKEATPSAQAVPQEPLPLNVFLDDGTGGDWEVFGGKEKQEKKKKTKAADAVPVKETATEKENNLAAAPVQRQDRSNAWKSKEQQEADVEAVRAAALARVEAIMNRPPSAAPVVEATSAAAATSTLEIPEGKIGMVIGPKGATLQMIKEKTGVERIDTVSGVGSTSTVKISGPEQAGVDAAVVAVKELIEKGITSIAFDEFAEASVLVHPSSIPDIVGKQGAVVRKLKEELKVEVTLPSNLQQKTPSDKKYPVVIAGEAANVEKAKQVINDICMYYCSPITHPSQIHAELEIAEENRRFLIGRQGSEMRHIQNNFKVQVFIPREHSANQKVVVVGAEEDVARAKVYIDKIMTGASNISSKPRVQAADNEEYDDDDHEAWMNQYTKKR